LFNSRRQKREDYRKLENRYYEVVYDILRGPRDSQDKTIELKRMKGKIVRLNSAYYQHMMLGSGQQNNYIEGPTQYHIIRGRERREQRTVHSLQTEDGELLVTSRAIPHAFHDRYQQQQHNKIPREDSHYQYLVQHMKTPIPNYAEAALMTPVTLGELHYVIQNSPRNQSPGTDGICYEFYRTHCEGIKEDLLAIIN
jgi:hypothetical protein